MIYLYTYRTPHKDVHFHLDIKKLNIRLHSIFAWEYNLISNKVRDVDDYVFISTENIRHRYKYIKKSLDFNIDYMLRNVAGNVVGLLLEEL